MKRTYRATARGRFESLTDQQRQQLRTEQHAHDMFAAQYTPEGTFLYPPELSGYQFRFLLEIDESSPEDADLAAQIEAQERAEQGLQARGLAGRIVKIDLMCPNDLKIRRRKHS